MKTISSLLKHDVCAKRQTAKMKVLSSLFSCVYSRVKLFAFAMNSRRLNFIFVCFIYGLEEKNSKSEVIFAVCRLPLTSCLTSLILHFSDVHPMDNSTVVIFYLLSSYIPLFALAVVFSCISWKRDQQIGIQLPDVGGDYSVISISSRASRGGGGTCSLVP